MKPDICKSNGFYTIIKSINEVLEAMDEEVGVLV